MHGCHLHPQVLQGWAQGADECVEGGDLAGAVADPAGDKAVLRVCEPHLVFDRRHHVVADLEHLRKPNAEHLARGQLAAAAVGPARRAQAYPPAGPPLQVVESRGIGMHDQVCGAGADAELFVIGDRRVHRVERQQQVGHHSAVANRGFESIRTKRLAAERAVHVGDDQQHELDVLRRSKINGSKRSLDLGFRHRDATSPSVAARRSIIMSSSPSELVKAGANTTSSPA